MNPLPPRAEEPIQDFFRDWKMIFLHPVIFSRDIAPTKSLNHALLLGLASHWICSAIGLVSSSAIEGMVQQAMQKMMQLGGNVASWNPLLSETQAFILRWGFGVAGVVVDPIFTLLKLLFWTAWVWLSARLLLRGRSIPYEALLKVSAYALAASPVLILPVVGTLAFSVYCFYLAVIGTRETLGIDASRSFWIQTLPYVAITLLGFAVFATMIGLFAALFLT